MEGGSGGGGEGGRVSSAAAAGRSGDGVGDEPERNSSVLLRLFSQHSLVRRVREDAAVRRWVDAMPADKFAQLLMYFRGERGETHRKRSVTLESFGQVVNLLRSAKKVLVLTGAGISTSCGIPDFRSRNGVYSMLDGYHLSDPQDLFAIRYFKRNTKPFYDFARKLWPGTHRPAPTHYFIKCLEDAQALHRNYTQNIDTLEYVAGISRVLQCHGSFATATCTRCSYKCDGSVIKEDILRRETPLCPRCVENPLPSLVVEFALGDSHMRAFRVAGDRSMSVSSDSDEEDSDSQAPKLSSSQASVSATSSQQNGPQAVDNTKTQEILESTDSIRGAEDTSREERGSADCSGGNKTPMKQEKATKTGATVGSAAGPVPSQNLFVSTTGSSGARFVEPDSPFTSSRASFGLPKHINRGPSERSNSLSSELELDTPCPANAAVDLRRTNSLSSNVDIFENALHREVTPLPSTAAGTALGSSETALVSNLVLGLNDPSLSRTSTGLSVPPESGPRPTLSTSLTQDLSVASLEDGQGGVAGEGDQRQVDSQKKSSGIPKLGSDTTNTEKPCIKVENGTEHDVETENEIEKKRVESVSDGQGNPLRAKETNLTPGAGENDTTAPAGPQRNSAHSSSSNSSSSQLTSVYTSSDAKPDHRGTRALSSNSGTDFEAAPEGMTDASSVVNEESVPLDELPFVDVMFDRGIMKPDVVFFGESLPKEFFDVIEEDVKQCDLVLVMGTSLKVAPVSRIIEMVDPSVPQILVNREVVAEPHEFDAELLGNCDNVTAAIAKELGWDLSTKDTAISVASLNLEYSKSEHRPGRFLFEGAMEGPLSDSEGEEDEEDGGEEEGGSSELAGGHAGGDGNCNDVAVAVPRQVDRECAPDQPEEKKRIFQVEGEHFDSDLKRHRSSEHSP